MSNRIQISANGISVEIPEHSSLEEFLASREQSLERVVVERNGEALTRKEARAVMLEPGDRLEIVRIVAGG